MLVSAMQNKNGIPDKLIEMKKAEMEQNRADKETMQKFQKNIDVIQDQIKKGNLNYFALGNKKFCQKLRTRMSDWPGTKNDEKNDVKKIANVQEVVIGKINIKWIFMRRFST